MPNTSTHPVAAVTSGVQTDVIASALTEQLLQPRRVYLKHRAPKSAYVHDLRRKMASSLVRPMAMITAVMGADIDDGIPVEIVTAWCRSLIALNEERAKARDASRPRLVPDSLEPLHQRETRAEALLNEAQNAALAHPDDPHALAVLEDAATQYEVAEHALVDAARRTRERLALGIASR